MSSLYLARFVNISRPLMVRAMSSGSAGEGSIREAGGAFSKKEKAIEDQYFYNLQKQQLEGVRNHLHEEIQHHEESIQRHQEAIDRHKNRIKEMEAESTKK